MTIQTTGTVEQTRERLIGAFAGAGIVLAIEGIVVSILIACGVIG